MKRTRKINKGYIITNIVNGKLYVGITSSSIEHRWKLHLLDASYPNHYNGILHKAINKYGAESFTMEVIKKSYSWKEIQNWEIKTIKELNTKPPRGYNLADGGEGCPGVIRTGVFKKMLSERKIQYYKDPEKRKEQSIRQKKLKNTPEAKEKSRKCSKRLWQSSEYREKTTREQKKACNNPLYKKQQSIRLIKYGVEHPEWLENLIKRNKEHAKTLGWGEKISIGQKRNHALPGKKEEESQRMINFWKLPQEKRRNTNSKTMRAMINKKLSDPIYQIWRKENPPGGKPILYNFKYFRSIQEAADYFKLSRPTIDRHLLLKKQGCRKLNLNKKYNFEIQYN